MVEKRDTDVFIVGGGPAGLTAAIAARQKGFRVTVADGSAPPIEKPCGEGMLPETLSALQALGVNIGRGDGQKFPGISFIEDGLRVYADFTDGQGLGLRRTILHQRLVERAAECGVQLLWRTPVLGIDGETARLRGGTIRLPLSLRPCASRHRASARSLPRCRRSSAPAPPGPSSCAESYTEEESRGRSRVR